MYELYLIDVVHDVGMVDTLDHILKITIRWSDIMLFLAYIGIYTT